MRFVRGKDRKWVAIGVILGATAFCPGRIQADLITTTAGGTVTVGSGLLTDAATLSGGVNPTGTITFTLFDPTNTVVDTETVAVSGNGTYTTPTGFVPTVAGTYQWQASYSGDANNSGVTSGLGDEPQTVKPTSGIAISTTPSGRVVLGTGMNLSDAATLSGGFKPTGTITFTLFDPTNTVVDTETVAVSGDGTYTTPAGFLPGTAGTYEWQATYSGDANNSGVTSAFGDEPETVDPTSGIAIGTTPSGPVVLGTGMSLSDAATLSGGFKPTGTITFTLFDPTNTVVDTETVAVSGDGTYTTPAGFLPVTAGTYEWQATYSGDANNNGVTSAPGDEPESVSGSTSVPEPSSFALIGIVVIGLAIKAAWLRTNKPQLF